MGSTFRAYLRTTIHACALVAALGCSGREHVDDEDGGPETSGDAGADASRDAGTDAFVPQDGGGHDDGGPPAVWTLDSCVDATMRGRTGDVCVGGFRCGSMTAIATCDTTDHLVVARYDAPACTAPAPAPWSSCEEALDGVSGQRCEGVLACAETDLTEPCCAALVLCNPASFFGGGYPADMLYRVRVCDTGCGLEPRPDRTAWTACPPVWSAGATEPLAGDPCEGTWACMAGPDRFGGFPADLLTVGVPVWCDGEVLHVGPGASALYLHPAVCE